MSSETSPFQLASASGQASSDESVNPLSFFRLRPYQLDIARSVLDSIFYKRGLTFSVEIARQGGKNELSAQLELLLLTLYITRPWNIIKCSPTFKPQTVISMMRLKDRLNDFGFAGIWTTELGYIIRLGNARTIFLSADKSANVVGNTAHLLLEIDESQDVNKEKYSRDFKPMGATTNTTTVHYGTTWDDTTLLEEIKQSNLDLEKKDGVRRHFHYDWQTVAEYNPDYLSYVENERQRLGENHPLFLTQYCLLPVHGGGGFLSSQQKAQLQGTHFRRNAAEKGKVYVAGIDIAGETNFKDTGTATIIDTRQDATVLTIAELDFTVTSHIQKQPAIRIVEHYCWTAISHVEVNSRVIDLLKNVWNCRRIVIDATGMGQPIASFLRQTFGSRLLPFTFTAKSKSQLGFNLLAAVNSGRLKMYAGDGSPEFKMFWSEIDRAKSQYRPNQILNFYVDPSDGHDDFLMSLALVVEAAHSYRSREARGK